MRALMTGSFAWLCAARWRGRCPRCVFSAVASGLRSARALMSWAVACMFCAATCSGVRLSRSCTAAASGVPMATTVAMLWATPGWAAARCRGVAPKELVIDAARLAAGCFIRRRVSCGGASNRAQQCSGVNFSRFVMSNGHAPTLDFPPPPPSWGSSGPMSISTILPMVLSSLPRSAAPCAPSALLAFEMQRWSGVSPLWV
mmetsp:Transcript_47827/g.144648  ORF Transcript_47827/g.144648 Transcript_47827/m.144648 type:complete len:201 (+) Transcript_47827:783-1385(+)